jgi:DNA-binding NarL/FixJ family response regulator
MNDDMTVLLAASGGSLRDALRAMLVSMPNVRILEASDTNEAESILLDQPARLVIIDSALPGNHTMQLVELIQQLRPRPRCAILVDTVVQQASALRAGADRAFLKGEPPARLFAQVEQLLSPAFAGQPAR